MTTTDKNLIEAYSNLFEGLSAINKIELIERLTKSLKIATKRKESNFYKSFGAFSSDNPQKKLSQKLNQAEISGIKILNSDAIFT